MTALSFSEAIEKLQRGPAADELDPGAVDGHIVLGFGAAMLVVDGMMLRAILFRSDICGAGSPGGEDPASGGCQHPSGHPAGFMTPALGLPAWAQVCKVSPRTELNLFSGLSHVAADTLRSFTQIVVGAVIMAGGPSEKVDAYGTLAISAIILVGASFLLYEVALQGREWLAAP